MNGRRVFKYPIHDATLRGDFPAGSVPRHFGMQHGTTTLWIEVTDALVAKRRTFCIFGTGHEIPDGAVYVGTCMDREFVWHLYEVTDGRS